MTTLLTTATRSRRCTFWYSQAAIVPEIDTAILVVSNKAGTGQQAADMAFEALTEMYPE